VQFSSGGDRSFPDSVRVRGPGDRKPPHCALQCDGSSYGGMDLQQLWDAIPSDHPYQFLIHDRDTIFSSELDAEVKSTFGLRVLRTPVRAPQANAYCERLMGTVRRECWIS
jgi:hypothetical protein